MNGLAIALSHANGWLHQKNGERQKKMSRARRPAPVSKLQGQYVPARVRWHMHGHGCRQCRTTRPPPFRESQPYSVATKSLRMSDRDRVRRRMYDHQSWQRRTTNPPPCRESQPYSVATKPLRMSDRDSVRWRMHGRGCRKYRTI